MNPLSGSDKKEQLLRSEWIVVLSLLLLMASLVVIAKINSRRCSGSDSLGVCFPRELCSVSIDGAVSKPGVFKVSPGTVLKKIVRKSAPLPFADLKKIDLEQRVEDSMSLTVGMLQEISVVVEGLSPQLFELKVPPGTRVCDLKTLLPKDSIEGKGVFKSRRVLKDGEVIMCDKSDHIEDSGVF